MNCFAADCPILVNWLENLAKSIADVENRRRWFILAASTQLVDFVPTAAKAVQAMALATEIAAELGFGTDSATNFLRSGTSIV